MIDRPTVITICEIRPTPRLRSLAKPHLSSAYPSRPPATTAIGAATRMCIPSRLRNHATNAPNVTISPWAKLVRPVVPKISDSPTEHMAMINPSRTPSAKRCAHLSTVDCSIRWLVPVK